ncbi:hypothetical protein CTI12_AA340490 [Artemisia annua]|uniref:COBRA C-terminal domain-containing protein n=1 Tax=Artemisia annua TaxID=35608 RepID=A0A2U1MUI7_ARTAN|nr:hypothetical protein CTI12_AA340490 [Artemisia annua]
MQVQNCCKAGVLSSLNQDPANSMASFQMNVESLEMTAYDFKIGIPGYTCGNATKVPPTKYISANGRRRTQALGTWNVICTYSPFRASVAPKCCVSLSSFYSETIVPCPTYDSGVFYGLEHYNAMLLHAGDGGNVQTELLFHKDPETFTFKEGWAFPKKVMFNGDVCVMPPPYEYPTLPNSGSVFGPSTLCMLILSLFYTLIL